MRLTQAGCTMAATLFAATLAVSACSRPEWSRSHDSTSGKSTDTASGVGTASPTSPASPASPATDNTAIDSATTVTATGYGALRIGMTVVNAATALHSPTPPTAGLDTACAYVHMANAPTGMRIMITGGTVARIEVDSSTIATGMGARVGDSEARVQQLYGSRVTLEPHKYLPEGHYLIVGPIAPPADSAFRLIFETDGSRVTAYRAGRLPEVRWVEGCA
jgi:hypothetical protein